MWRAEYMLLTMALALVAAIAMAAQTNLSAYKREKLNEAGKFDPARRYGIHMAMNDLYMHLWRDSKHRRIMRTVETGTFPSYPVLQLSDKDSDGIAEEFMYSKKKGDLDTREFGFFFDLNGDGEIDYLIFNGGLMLSEGEDTDVWWMNYHAIDSNADGKIDQVLYQGSSDMNGNGRVEPTVGLWLIDDDFDGNLDRAAYVGERFEEAAPVKDGALDLSKNLILSRKSVHVGDPIGPFWDRILADISTAPGDRKK